MADQTFSRTKKLPSHIKQDGNSYSCDKCSARMVLGEYTEPGKQEQIRNEWVIRHGH